VFSEDGVLTLSNTAYNLMWRTDPGKALKNLTLGHALREWRTDSPAAADWGGLGDTMARGALRRPMGFTVERLTGRRLDCRFVPLSGGALLAGFSEAPVIEAAIFRRPKADEAKSA
jgi:hypothetical protein